jgi:hypothetical protein
MSRRFTKGDRVRALTTITFQPDLVLKAGEMGYVTRCTDTGIEIMLDCEQAALRYWDNHLWLEEPELSLFALVPEPAFDALPMIAEAVNQGERFLQVRAEAASAARSFAPLRVEPRPAALERQRTAPAAWRRPLLGAGAGVVLLLAFGAWVVASNLLHAAAQLPYEQGDLIVTHKLLHVGEPLEITFNSIQREPCVGDVDRYWFNKTKGLTTYQRGVFMAAADPANKIVAKHVTMELPGGFAPGAYEFHSIMRLTCGSMTYITTGFTIEFVVVAD